MNSPWCAGGPALLDSWSCWSNVVSSAGCGCALYVCSCQTWWGWLSQ